MGELPAPERAAAAHGPRQQHVRLELGRDAEDDVAAGVQGEPFVAAEEIAIPGVGHVADLQIDPQRAPSHPPA